jgi:hypothetical protein
MTMTMKRMMGGCAEGWVVRGETSEEASRKMRMKLWILAL